MNEDDLKAAVQAHDNAIEEARRTRNERIRQAAAEGMRQVDIIKITGYSRETIRRIVQGIDT